MKNNGDIVIRPAKPEDIAGILEIYAPYVLNTAITFEYDVPGYAEVQNRYETITQKYPFLAAVADGELAGYAYAGSFIDRQAYDWTVELSIYIKETMHKKGIGRKLYAELEKILRLQHVQICYVCIAWSSADHDPYIDNTSILFHQKLGYAKIGEFLQCGYKFDRWYNMCVMEKRLVMHNDAPKPFIPFAELNYTV